MRHIENIALCVHMKRKRVQSNWRVNRVTESLQQKEENTSEELTPISNQTEGLNQ